MVAGPACQGRRWGASGGGAGRRPQSAPRHAVVEHDARRTEPGTHGGASANNQTAAGRRTAHGRGRAPRRAPRRRHPRPPAAATATAAHGGGGATDGAGTGRPRAPPTARCGRGRARIPGAAGPSPPPRPHPHAGGARSSTPRAARRLRGARHTPQHPTALDRGAGWPRVRSSPTNSSTCPHRVAGHFFKPGSPRRRWPPFRPPDFATARTELRPAPRGPVRRVAAAAVLPPWARL